MAIWEALRQSRELQRTLAAKLRPTSGDTPDRRSLFATLKDELAVHALTEERHFYIPLMQLNPGVDLSRYAIAEHHAIDELVEALQATDAFSPGWLPWRATNHAAWGLRQRVRGGQGEPDLFGCGVTATATALITPPRRAPSPAPRSCGPATWPHTGPRPHA